jgi:ABC-type branched-subunit amino acid transport system ATPase component/ABC-type branched-subunit amino acid transport system permease subunit
METLALAALLALPLIVAKAGSYRMYLSEEMIVYAGAAVGLTILLGVAKQFHLGQSAFMAMGAYAAAIISQRHGDSLPKELIFGILAGGLLGFAVGAATLRLTGLYFALATLAVVLGVQSLAGNWNSFTGGNAGIVGIPGIVLWSAHGQLGSDQTYLLLAALLLVQGALIFALKRSTYWGALKLIGDRAYLASCVGIRVFWYRVAAFVVVSMTGALWGAFYAHLVGYIDPTTFGLSLTIPLLMMVVLGGLGSFWGAIAGAIILVQIPEWLASLQSQEQLVYGGILLGVILLFPKGVLPSLRDAVGWAAGKVHARRDPHQQARANVGRDNARLLVSPMSFDGAPLQASEIAVNFGGVHALRGASISAAAGRIEGLIGPNGSGKTTMLNSVSGLVHPDSGSILLDGEEIVGIAPHRVARRGLMRTFQTPQVVLDMTTLENAVLGWHQRRKTNVLSVALRFRGARREEARQLEEARKMCTELDLGDVLERPAGELSTGDRRFVEIARALGSQPRVLFLDEPATGMTGLERERLMIVLDRLRQAGLTIIVIDHDMEFLFQMADHVTVLDRGENIAFGSPNEVRDAPAVIDAYFGKPAAHA